MAIMTTWNMQNANLPELIPSKNSPAFSENEFVPQKISSYGYDLLP
jgi:hypothetical protein